MNPTIAGGPIFFGDRVRVPQLAPSFREFLADARPGSPGPLLKGPGCKFGC